MNIAILGGSFDPPHNGHLSIAQQILRLTDTQQVWLMPCYYHPFAKTLTPFQHRLMMAKFLVSDRIQVSDFEIQKRGTSYTIDTLNGLAAQHPHHKLSWIIGDDQISSFQKWKNWEEIVTKYTIIVVPRSFQTPSLVLPTPKPNITIIPSERWQHSSVSSTEIRQAVKFKKPIMQQVPLAVAKYILQNKLYQ